MPFTQRFVKLLFGIPLLVALSLLWQPFAFVAVAHASCLVVLLLVDMKDLPARKGVAAIRRLTPTIGIGLEKEYEIEIRNRSTALRPHEIIDSVPPQISWRAIKESGSAPPTFVMKGLERGAYRVGPVYARFVGKLGLAERRFKLPENQEIRVIPHTPGLSDQRLRRGLLRSAGNRRLRLTGKGDEFESLRFYHADDDPRHIDWRSTARKGKLLTRSYQPESKQRVMVAMDLGRTMIGRSGDISKADTVLNHCLLMAHTALAEGDSVGFLGFADSVIARMPIASGKRQIHQLLELSAHLDAQPVETDYRLLLRELSVWERKRSLLILFTDFIDETQTEDLRTVLATLGRKHRLLLVAVRDPELYALANSSATTDDEAFAVAAAAHLIMHRNVALKQLQQMGVVVADLDQRDLATGIVERYLRMREAAVF